jgi:hypothetical protein
MWLWLLILGSCAFVCFFTIRDIQWLKKKKKHLEAELAKNPYYKPDKK